VPDAEVAGGLVEVWVAWRGEEPADALFGAWACERGPDGRGELGGAAEAGDDMAAAVDTAADCDAEAAGVGGQVVSGDAGFGGDVFEAPVADVVLLAGRKLPRP
jgi:hypothetical protein